MPYDIIAIDRKIQLDYPKLKEEFDKMVKFDFGKEIIKQKKEVGLEAMSDLAYIVYCYLSGNDGSEAIKIKEVLDDFNDQREGNMEKENFNVKVSNKIIEILDRDMETFNQKNRNSMINKIIFTYLKIKNEDDIQEKILNDIKKIEADISKEKEKKIKEIIKKNIYETLTIKKGNSKLVNFHLNKKTFDECKSLGENSNYFDTEFFRVVFEWYTLKAKYKREQILFHEEIEMLKEAINKKYELEFNIKANDGKLVKIKDSYPFGIFESKDENFNYLVTVGKNGETYSTRISNMRNVSLIRKVFSVSKEVEEKAKKRIENKYYGMGNTVQCKIEFTEEGYSNYKTISHLRPKPEEVDEKNRVLSFREPEDSLFFYFKQFGGNIKVLEPQTLKNRLKEFYKKALENYEG